MRSLLFTIAICIISYSSIAQQPGELVWEDNFNEGVLDTTRWSIETGTG